MSKDNRLVCALVSGGIDSAILLHRLLMTRHRVFPLYVRCGLRWEATELSWLRRLLRAMRSPQLLPLRVVNLPLQSVYGTHWSLTGRQVPAANSSDNAVYLPGRNVLLLSAAAIICAKQRVSTIALGILGSNPFGDASPRFFSQFAGCLAQALQSPIRVLSPLRQSSKARWIRRAANLPYQLTFSCLQPRGHRHCGRCNKCAERARAFLDAGIPDPTHYAR